MKSEIIKKLDSVEYCWPKTRPFKLDTYHYADNLKMLIQDIWEILVTNYPSSFGVAILLQKHNLLSEFKRGYASTKYHGNFEGGLWIHTLLVTAKAIEFYSLFKKQQLDITIEDVITTAILHDIGKLGIIDRSGEIILPYYVLDSTAIKYNKDIAASHAALSAQAFLCMYTDEQKNKTHLDIYKAIRYHNGAYEPGFTRAINGNESPLLLIIHWADMYVARMLGV